MPERAPVTSGRAPAAERRTLRGHAGNPPGQGPFLTLEIDIESGRIVSARYETYLCPACHECGKAMCALVEGGAIEDAAGIKWDDLAARVTSTGGQRRSCLGLALLALDDALVKLGGEDHLQTKKERTHAHDA